MKKYMIFVLILTELLILAGSINALAGTYSYDSLDRLTKATLSNGKSIDYYYDSAGNIIQAICTGCASDTTAPVIPIFELPADAWNLNVPINALVVSDNVWVTQYCLTETNSNAGCVWSSSKPAGYNFTSYGTKTLYAWIKDAAGNISVPVAANTVITKDIQSPSVTSFTIPSTANNLNVAITSFNATDNTGGSGVTNWCLTESNNSSACAWASSAPASYHFSTAGNKQLYAFAKDAMGNVSTSASATTTITLPVTLRVTVDGGGAGNILASGLTCTAGNCTGSYPPGTQVSISAAAISPSIFMGWVGDSCSGTATCSFTINFDTNLIAYFGNPATRNILVNGDFESGNTGWTSYSSQIISQSTGGGYNSDWYAYLGGLNSITDTIYQDVSIPVSATKATFSFWYGISTTDGTSTVYDTFTVRVLDSANGGVLQELVALSNKDAASVWKQSASFDLSALIGQQIRLEFQAKTDSSNTTDFLVDNVALIIEEKPEIPKVVLTTAISGSGSGSIVSNPIGIACSGANNSGCNASFLKGLNVTLLPTASNGSYLSSWAGTCVSTQNGCVVNMNSDKSITANFNVVDYVQIGSNLYGTLSSAYENAPADANIQARGLTFVEDLILSRGVNVTLYGGFLEGYLSRAGFSELDGSLTISTGSLTVDGLTIK